jgi:hypothetical protein
MIIGMIKAIAVAATWRHRGRWRYNIVAAATPVTDRDNGQQPGSGGGSSGVPAPHPGAQDESGGGRNGDVGCDQVPAQRAVLRRGGDRAPGPGPDPGGRAAHPSAGNQQAWDFVVCTDPEQLAQLAEVFEAAGHVAGSAATIALVAPHPDDAQMRDLIQFDLGQATMSIMLAAADLGIGSAHAGVHDQELARRLLGVPEDRFCALLITLGAPADRSLRPIQRPNRRPFNDVVHRGHW